MELTASGRTYHSRTVNKYYLLLFTNRENSVWEFLGPQGLMVRWLAIWSTSGPAWAGFYLLRLAERVLCVRALSVLLWLPAAGCGLVELRWRALAASWRRFPESWRPKPIHYLLRRTFGHPHAGVTGGLGVS